MAGTWILYPVLAICHLLPSLDSTSALPTLGYVDRNRLETYEDLPDRSNDLDLFSNLTFRFSCKNRSIGLYADVDYDCRIFHVCDEHGTGFPVICPNDAFFDQRQRICTDEEKNDCERAYDWYHVNELPYSNEAVEQKKMRPFEEEEIPTVMPLVTP